MQSGRNGYESQLSETKAFIIKRTTSPLRKTIFHKTERTRHSFGKCKINNMYAANAKHGAVFVLVECYCRIAKRL